MTPGDDPHSQPAAGKPFPRFCPDCGRISVWQTTAPYATTVRHDGAIYQVDVPHLQVPRCEACGEMIFDDQAGEQVSRAFRELLGLLAPGEIRAQREQLGLAQHELATHLGVAATTIVHWEEGLTIQSRAIDRYLRVYFQSPEARAAVVQLSAMMNS